MEDIEPEELKQNDKEFIESSKINKYLISSQINHLAPPIYNPEQFQKDIIIKYFQNKKILINNINCPKCGNLCKLVNQNSALDKKIWRCRFNGHDIKIGIRKYSIFENSQVNIQILYFIIFHCLIERKSIEQTIIDTNEFSKQIGLESTTKQTICNVFSLVREKIRLVMHNIWRSDLLGIEIGDEGYPSIEIDESLMISNGNIQYWMFGLIDRQTKNARVYCVLSDRTKNNLIPIVKNNVSTNVFDDEDDENFQNFKALKQEYIQILLVVTKERILRTLDIY